MLLLLISIPLFGILSILMLNNVKLISSTNNNNSRSKLLKWKYNIKIGQIGLITSIINLLVALIIWSGFNSLTSGYQYRLEFSGLGIYQINLGIDGISLYFILLTCLLIPIVILSNWNNIEKSYRTYIIIILLLESLILMVFLVMDLIMFYIFFESILPPLFILIGIWGGSDLKIWASFHIFLYTFIGSLFMLLSFLTIYFVTGSFNYEYLADQNINFNLQIILWLGIFLSIAVKSPLWPFMTWLPLAHAESPLGGSIILAGIILKLALYAVLRILIPILPEASLYFTPFVYLICIITIIYTSLTCLRQIDLKVLVAYSSIGHMGVSMIGAFSNQIEGISGSILLGIGHGFVSPALFILLGGVLYDRYHTRIINYYRGLTQYMPIFSFILFLFILANMGTPLTLNFIGEFLSLKGGFETLALPTILASSSIILSASYSIYLYNRITGGIKSPYLKYQNDLTNRELSILLPLLILTFLTGIYPNIILSDISYNVSNLIYQF